MISSSDPGVTAQSLDLVGCARQSPSSMGDGIRFTVLQRSLQLLYGEWQIIRRLLQQLRGETVMTWARVEMMDWRDRTKE